MKLRILLLIISITVIVALCGCSNSDIAPEPTPETTHPIEQTTEPSTLETEEPAEPTEELPAFMFDDVSNLEFYFASGAGGWRTILHIKADGSFEGVHSDSEMGITGEDYPNGTYYICEFGGAFSAPEKVNDYIYSFNLESLVYSPSDVVEIIDGVRYVNSTPYGIENGEEFYLYLPGTPLSELPEGYINWVGRDIYTTENAQEPTLPFYGLYNVTEECGFSSYKMMTQSEIIAATIKQAEDSAAVIEDTLNDPYITQGDMNAASYELYVVWDNALNDIWQILKNNLDEDTMAALTTEEIAWIHEKEAAMEEAGKDVEGGSLYPTVVNTVATEYTQKRVYVLAEYTKLIP